jgi:serine/threonine-protein kinase
MPLSAGDKLGPYEVLGRLGAGGMGEVWKVRDTRLDRTVAIKTSHEQFSERFAREARAIAALNHPNICQLYDVGPDYLVMEFIDGAPLKGPLPVEQALKYGAQICEALDAAHRKNITHRDLKPANIMVAKAGVKLLDFGLARTAPLTANDETVTMAVMGTPAYMSPEQWEGKPGDARSDIYALGCVLYEMLTGKRASTERSPVEPAELESVIRRCLEKDPDERWQSARDLRYSLDAAAQARPLVAPRRDPGVAWIAAAVLAIAAATISVIHFRENPPPQPLTRFSVDLGPDAVAQQRTTAAISPDGRRLVFVARSEGGKAQLATRLLEQPNYTLLPGTDNAIDPFFSPDGQWIGFFADTKMKKISVQSGAATVLADAPGGRGASWGEDGNIIFTPNLNVGVGLSLVPATGGAAKVLTKPENGDVSHRWPQILPGGEDILFSTTKVPGAYEDGRIDVLSLKTGKSKTVQQGGYFGRYLPTGHLVYVHQATLYAVPFDLARMEVRGVPVPVLDDVAGDPAFAAGQFDFSRTGAFVYLGGRSLAQRPIAWLDSAGKTQTLTMAPGLNYSPRFSPDGKRLSFNAALNTIQVYDLQRDTMTQVTRDLAVTPVWAPDGNHIAYATVTAGGGSSIQWSRSDGAGEPFKLLEDKYQVRVYSFSSDGRRLAYTEDNLEGVIIWTLPLDLSDPGRPKPGKPERFIATPGTTLEPAFSPDGRWIAYQSQETSVPGINVRPFPGPGGQWVIATTAVHPIWSRNGRELFFENPNERRIWVVTYTTKGDTFIPDKPRLWSDVQIQEPNVVYWNLDLAPDGKRFAVFPSPDAAADRKSSVHVTVLLNFFDELRRRVPTGK